ncbi:restriction endonuclease subunit S [Vibrio kanaloae]|uniref:restriction endonuclease subunit S n=1 Tax=Vibrio kanaloae TaxID=170673 RepID=UPI000988D15E|nr:restriction endonuclease subunit S [Vibrio kanaloae]QPK05077.1 restriction endonuclease subunit S [Vibrio kanaloae]
MRSHYKRIGDYVTQIKLKNVDNSITSLKGININKHFMPSVANINGTDLSKYRVVKKNQFAFNPMHVGRDEVLPISMLEDEEPIIVSPAYVVFEVKDEEELLPAYLMMWCRRSEFDRNAWFMTDNSVRGGFSWVDFCNLEIPILDLKEQQKIVAEYLTVSEQITFNKRVIEKVESVANSLFKQWFVDFNFPISQELACSIGRLELVGKPYRASGGAMDQGSPTGWEMKTIKSYSSVTSGFAFKSAWWRERGAPVIKIGSFHDNTVNYETLDYVEPERILGKDKFACRSGDIVIAMTGFTMGKIGLVPALYNEYHLNQRVGKFELGESPIDRAAYLYCFLQSDDFKRQMAGIGGDSRQANVSADEIENFNMQMPDTIVLERFNSLMKPCLKLIMLKVLKNHNLKSLSEVILQKMSKA